METSSFYEMVFTQSSAAHCLLAPGPDAIIIAVNDALADSSGQRREDLVGRSLFEAFPDDRQEGEASESDTLRCSILRVIEFKKPDHMMAQRYPIQRIDADGRVRFEERFWDAVNAPVFDADGRLIAISHTTIDVTKRTHAEMALRRSEERFRSLVLAASKIIWLSDANGAVTESPAWGSFTGQTESEWKSFGWLAAIHPDDRAALIASWKRSLEDRSLYEMEARIRRRDGEYRWMSIRAVPIQDADGSVREWIGACTDITDRKAHEEWLKAADRRKDEFLAMLAHELRNPLAPIGTAAHILKLASNDPERVRETSDVIARQVKHMTELVNDLLDVSRVSRDLVVLDKSPQDLKTIVSAAVEQARPLLEARQHVLHLKLGGKPAFVCGDPTRLIQIIVNLLTNAAKYTPHGGEIVLELDRQEKDVKLCVTDNGVGIDPQLLPHIFELFTQAERTPDRSQGGLGLGLALVKNLAAMHGGRVEAHSEGAGTGSTFVLVLPGLDTPSPNPATSDAGSVSAKPAVKPRDILIVDDNEDAAKSLAALLSAEGHSVRCELDAFAALKAAALQPPDVCILDIGLPGMDGHELAKRLKNAPGTAHTFLIALTGYGQPQDRERSQAAGFDRHLVKPIEIGIIDKALAQLEDNGNDLSD